jgi:hypothetical protein
MQYGYALSALQIMELAWGAIYETVSSLIPLLVTWNKMGYAMALDYRSEHCSTRWWWLHASLVTIYSTMEKWRHKKKVMWIVAYVSLIFHLLYHCLGYFPSTNPSLNYLFYIEQGQRIAVSETAATSYMSWCWLLYTWFYSTKLFLEYNYTRMWWFFHLFTIWQRSAVDRFRDGEK